MAAFQDALSPEPVLDPARFPLHRQLIAAAEPLLTGDWPGQGRFMHLIAGLEAERGEVTMAEISHLLRPMSTAPRDREVPVSVAIHGILLCVLASYGSKESHRPVQTQVGTSRGPERQRGDEAAKNEHSEDLEDLEDFGETLEELLDRAHFGLVQDLAKRNACSRDDLEAACRRWRLLPDGALDLINEASLDLCGRRLFTGSDPVVLDQGAWAELQQ